MSEFDIVVAGGGIAGLTAGLTAARLGRKTLILTGDQLGGNLLSIEKIDGFPGFPDGVAGFELCPSAQAQAADAGCEFETTEVQALEGGPGAWQLKTADGDFTARAVILATGSTLRKLGVPGEEEFEGRGVSHCASCDAPLLKDKAVVVVGGGDSALQEAITLSGACSKVTILERGAALNAQDSYKTAIAGHANVEVRFNATIEAIAGANGVETVTVKDMQSGASTSLAVSSVFTFVGLAPNTGYLDGKLRLDERGGILTDTAMATELEGVFAAGAVRAGWSGRAVASAGEGTAAAISADAYLRSKG